MSEVNPFKLLYSVLILLLILSTVNADTGIYGFTKINGFVHSYDNLPIENLNISMHCFWDNGASEFYSNNYTNINGFYTFSHVHDSYTSSSNNTMVCNVSSTNASVKTWNVFTFNITQGEFKEVGESYNFTYEHYNGSACFKLSSVKGFLKSTDDILIKNVRVNLTCSNELINSTITSDDGFYNFTGLYTYSCNDSTGDCSKECNIVGVNEPIETYNFSLNIHGLRRDSSNPIQSNESLFLNTSSVNLTYNSLAQVNTTFYPSSSVQGNISNVWVSVNPLNFTHVIYNCTYSINESLPYSQGIHFNQSYGNYSYMINLTNYNTSTYYVACKTVYSNNAFGNESVNYTFDLTPPFLNLTQPKSDIIYDQIVNFNITTNEPCTYCEYNMSSFPFTTISIFNPMNNLSNSNTSFGITYNFSNDGRKIFLVQCRDEYYNWNYTTFIFNISVDFTPPVKTNITYADYTNAGNIIIVRDGVSDAYEYYVYEGLNGVTEFNKSDPSRIVDNSSTEWVRHSVDLSKWYYYRVAAVDVAGNIAELSEVAGPVKPESISEAEEEISELNQELNQYKSEEERNEQEIIMTAQVNANITRLLTDFNKFENISTLLNPSINQDVNTIRSKLLQAKSASLLDWKKVYYNEVLNLLNQFQVYETGESFKQFSNSSINGLRIDTSEDLTTVNFNNTNHNKYIIEHRVFNTLSNNLENITLNIPLPTDAVLTTNIPVSNNSIVYNISSLEPGEKVEFNYTYYTYTNYDNDLINGRVSEVIPPEPPEPITGFLGAVFKPGERDEFNTGYNLIIWGSVLVMSLLYWKKETVLKFLK